MSNLYVIVPLVFLLGFAVLRTVRKARKGGGCCGDINENEKRQKSSDRNKADYPYELTLTIGGMTCENCAVKVENALNALDGVWAKVDIGSHTARIRSKIPPEEQKIRQAVVRAGYVPME
ncbi:MAG: heavy-metal-associated domain-containing protein [Clostridia bacterium]|nr:heavy-metal-associated domain-containing protein [Clostridia bacterium]